MSYGDFCALTPGQFGEVCKAYNEAGERDYRNGWEMTRVHAAICVQPYSKKALRSIDVLRLPWDEKRNPQAVRMSKEEQLKRMEVLRKKVEEEESDLIHQSQGNHPLPVP